MKALDFINPPSVYLEIGESSLKVLAGENGLELPLERQENGRLTTACQEKLRHGLRHFLRRHAWQPRQRALCAIGARGVSLRRLTLPSASKEELQRLLLLQIESEFPLPPDELAWGCRQLKPEHPAGDGAPAVHELLVAAVKKDTLKEYSDILSRCGLNPVFTLGALARSFLGPQSHGSYAVLDIGRRHSELISFADGVPISIRVLQWGGEDITHSLEQRLAVSHDEAERLKLQSDQESASNGELGPKVQAAIRAAVDTLAGLIHPTWTGQKLYLAGGSARLKGIAAWLGAAIGGGVECQQMEPTLGTGRSAAILGLKESSGRKGDGAPLILQLTSSRGGEGMTPPVPWKWAAIAGMLAFACLSLRYAEAVLFKPGLSRRLAAAKVYRQQLPKIDRELSLLLYMKTNQPPYLDVLAIIANAAPGTRVEALSMSRRGDFSLRGNMRDSQQVADFRSKLIESSFFATVTVEEQSPSPDRQKLQVRITGQFKPAGERKPLPVEPTGQGPAKATTGPKEMKPSAATNVSAFPPSAAGTAPPR